jgi:lysophospholipase L1-like esterase
MQGFAKPQRGLGSGFILFGDRSTYEGELYYDGYQGFFRLGQGIQDFTDSNINGEIAGGPRGSKIHKYVGAFDYQKSQWIYGDGIFYFTDYQDNPLAWIKGFYSAFVKINDYSAASIPLIEGFTPEMEVGYAPEATKVANYQTQYDNQSEVDVLFAGDSYLEMWYPSFGIADYYEDMNELDTINVGIGATVFNQWVGWREALITRFTPQNIVLHLGFNDLHLGLSPEDTFTTMQTLMNEILDALPNSHIYLLTVEPSPLFANYYQVESTYNGLIKNYVTTNDNISIIDTASLFIEEGQPTSNLVTYFLGDGVHLNATGYRIWVDLIKSQLAI